MEKELAEEENENKEQKSIWKQVKEWAYSENFNPVVFSAGCCSSVWNLLESEQFKNMVSFECLQDELNGPDLMIIHGPVNAKRLAFILNTYERMSGKKYVVGIGTCLTHPLEGVNQVKDIEEKVPFDLIIPGCSVSADAIIEAIAGLGDIR